MDAIFDFEAMKWINATSLENIKIAYKAIKSQLLRTILTVLIIALGITALIAINTIAEAVKGNITSQFSKMGTNTLVIRTKNEGGNVQRGGKKLKSHPPISYAQAMKFKKDFTYEATTALSAMGSMSSTIKFEGNKTSPNVKVIGCDNQYMEMNSFDLEEGRYFSESELKNGTNAVIIGKDIITNVFKNKRNIIGSIISVGSHKYNVVGILKAQGSTFGMSNDNQCLIPLSNLKKRYGSQNTSYTLNVKVKDTDKIDEAQGVAISMLRAIRKDKIASEDSFEIQKSEQLASNMSEGIEDISFYISFIGYITLLGAGIGLMNIMLVSVTERTKEIGIRKAIGASAKRIRQQFLIEAILVGQIGGIAGIILGLIIGSAIAGVMQIDFIVPYKWIGIGFALCFITSILSGYFPASKASKMDPIESLSFG